MSEQRRPDDRELDDFVAGRDELSRRYKDSVEREGPPPELDSAILDRARQALEQEQRARKRMIAVPLALAATVVLSFGVFLSMRDKPGGLPPSAEELQMAKIQLAKEEKSVASASEVGAMRENDAVRRADAPAAPSPASQEPQMRQQASPAPVAAPAEAFAAKKAEQSEPAGQLAGGAAESEGSADAAPVVQPTKVPRSRSMLRDEKASSSKAWLERIRALKQKGEMDDARKELDVFRRAHPDEEVPEDLRPLMRPVTPPTP